MVYSTIDELHDRIFESVVQSLKLIHSAQDLKNENTPIREIKDWISRVSFLLKSKQIMDPSRIKTKIEDQPYFEEWSDLAKLAEKILTVKISGLILVLVQYFVMLITVVIYDKDIENDKKFNEIHIRQVNLLLRIGRTINKLTLKGHKDIICTLFSDYYNVSQFWIKKYFKLIPKTSITKESGLLVWSTLMNSLDNKLITLILTPNTWLISEILSNLELEYDEYHSKMLKILIDLTEDIYTTIGKI